MTSGRYEAVTGRGTAGRTRRTLLALRNEDGGRPRHGLGRGALSELRIALLGPPRIEIDGEPIQVDTRKAIAVLAYVTVAGPQTRDHLAAMLWPESDETKAKSALRRTLSVLKKGLGDRWLLLDRRDVALDDNGPWVDVEEFKTLARATPGHTHPPSAPCEPCSSRLEQAIALHRGEFLEGFSVRDATAFDEWQYAEAERVRRELATVLDRLVNARARAREYASAVDHAQRRLALDPLHEPTHRRMMLLHSWSGRRSDAIRQYRDCVAVLQRELGVAPLEQTTNLYEAILSGRAPEPPPTSESTHSAPQGAPSPTPPRVRRPPAVRDAPFVGREAELAQLLQSYRHATDGYVAVIEGEAGIGKTRLGAELAAAVRGLGGTVLDIQCHEGEAELAFTVVADIVRRAATVEGGRHLAGLSPAWRRELARLTPDLVEDAASEHPQDLSSSETRRRLLEAFRHAVTTVGSPERPTAIIIDDLQWVDEASLDALAYLCNRLAGAPLCLVLLWRSEAVREDHPLRQLVAENRQRDRLLHLRLERLGPDDVAELVEAAGLETTPELLDRLRAETEGLPLFLVEYLHGLDPHDGEVTDGWSVPAGVRDLLVARLRPLSDVARQVLAAAAAIGRSFDLETVRLVSGRGDEELVAVLEELTEAGMITEILSASSPRFDFRHDKLRTTVYEQLSLARRRLLHGRIADAFDRPGHREEPVPDAAVAQHLRLAGRDAEAAQRFLAAASHAQSLAAHTEAINHYRTALALGHDGAASLHGAIGDLLTLQGDYPAAIHAYESAAALTSDPAELALLEYELAVVHGRRGDWSAAEAHLEVALSTLEDDGPPELRARILIERATVAHRLEQDDVADRRAVEALEMAGEIDDPATQAQAHNVRGILARGRGDLGLASEELDRSLDLAEQMGSRPSRVAALNNLALVAGDLGEYPRALELAKTALALCRSLGDRHREAALLNNLADLLHAEGQHDEAMDHLKQAVAIFADIGEPEDHEPELWKLVDW